MRGEEFYFDSANGVNRIHVVFWRPEGEVKAVVQLSHGMVEYVERYAALAEYLNERGIAFIGNDHLGHGKSVASKKDYGYFAKENGDTAVLSDLHMVTQKIKTMFPGVPVILLGHSMGSFFARRYVTVHGEEIAGAIIMGTGYQPAFITSLGGIVASLIMKVKGERCRSSLMYQMMLGGYNKRFRTEGQNAWLSKETENVRRYNKDPLCSFRFTASACRDFMHLLTELAKHKDFDKIPKDLPVLFIAGEDDPVGDFGKGVKKAYKEYVALGMNDVSLKLYPGLRHEILNEAEKERVFGDIYEYTIKTFRI